MKRKERHQLKENELASMLGAIRGAVGARRQQIVGGVLIVLVAALVIAGVLAWRQRTTVQAEQMLADAMVTFNARVVPVSATSAQPGEVPAAATINATGSFPTQSAKLTAALPKLKAVADAYPVTEPGIVAAYHYASSLAALGRHDEAVRAFDAVITRAGGETLYGRMARFGKADAQAHVGQVDAAIATWKELAASPDETLPKDAILMELAKAYEAAGNGAEARKMFSQIVHEHPDSAYAPEARASLGG